MSFDRRLRRELSHEAERISPDIERSLDQVEARARRQRSSIGPIALVTTAAIIAVAVTLRLGAATPGPAGQAGVVPLPAGGELVVPGTFTSEYTPALTFSIGDVVRLDCASGSTCYGAVDVNSADWIDLEFGTLHGSEIDFRRLDQVYDPAAPTNLIAPPQDLSAWLSALQAENASAYHSVPGFAVFQPAQAVVIGGLPALQFDLQTAGNIQFGPMPDDPTSQVSIGPNALRVIFVTVHGQLVVISEWLSARNTLHDGPAALESLRSLVESITWK